MPRVAMAEAITPRRRPRPLPTTMRTTTRARPQPRPTTTRGPIEGSDFWRSRRFPVHPMTTGNPRGGKVRMRFSKLGWAAVAATIGVVLAITSAAAHSAPTLSLRTMSGFASTAGLHSEDAATTDANEAAQELQDKIAEQQKEAAEQAAEQAKDAAEQAAEQAEQDNDDQNADANDNQNDNQ